MKIKTSVKKNEGMRLFLAMTLMAGLLTLLSVGTASAQLIYGDAGQIYVTSGNTIKWYNQDGTGGTTVSIGTPNTPTGLDVAGGKLYVANYNSGGGNNSYVSKYPDSNAIGTMSGLPKTWDIAVSGSSIFVSWSGIDYIGKYTTGGAFQSQLYIGGTSDDPRGIAVDGSGNVYVANYGSGTIGKYTSSLGVISSSFITGLTNPEGLAIDSSGNIYVSSLSGNSISKYDSSGSLIGGFSITGLNAPSSISLDGAGNLFVANSGSGVIGKYDASTGATINDSFITGITGLTAVAASFPVVPEPSSIALLCMGGVAFLIYRLRRRNS